MAIALTGRYKAEEGFEEIGASFRLVFVFSWGCRARSALPEDAEHELSRTAKVFRGTAVPDAAGIFTKKLRPALIICFRSTNTVARLWRIPRHFHYHGTFRVTWKCVKVLPNVFLIKYLVQTGTAAPNAWQR